MCFRRRGFTSRAFTLVELLVVIGIITVLIAVLLPALNRVRAHAQTVKCQANLHSIGQALTLYTNHYGYYPGLMLTRPAGGGHCAVWPVRLRALMGGNQESFYCPAQDERCRWTDGMAGPNVRAAAWEASFGYEVGEQLLMESGMYFSYGYNAFGADGREEKGLGWYATPEISGHPHPHELRASRVRQPADMIAIADTTADGVYDFVISSYRDDSSPGAAAYALTWPGKIHGVHQSGANVLFCDGHVAWYPQDDLAVQYNIGYGSAQAALLRMWNYDHER